MIIAIFSLGQFISSNLNVLKTGFNEWFEKRNNSLTGEDVWKWMQGNLAPLRLGTISLNEFYDTFVHHFNLDMTFTEFSNIFNSMSKLDNASLERVTQFKHFLDEHPGIKFVLVSHTNYSHLNYILSQLTPILPNAGLSIISDQPNAWSSEESILFAPSMTSKSVGHPGTLNYALQKLNVSEHDAVVSFLDTIRTLENHTNFTYVEASKTLDNVASALEKKISLNLDMSGSTPPLSSI